METLKQQISQTETLLGEHSDNLVQSEILLTTEREKLGAVEKLLEEEGVKLASSEKTLEDEKVKVVEMQDQLTSEKRWHSETLVKLQEVNISLSQKQCHLLCIVITKRDIEILTSPG